MIEYSNIEKTVFSLKILLFTLFSVWSISAQNFERFSNKEGFNQNTINTIEQDKYGFLWFGTPNGLIRYNGYEFETYTTQSNTNGKILSNSITYIHNDVNGVLWIGTNLGLNAYVPSYEKFYTVPIPDEIQITHISGGPNGEVWFSGENQLYTCNLIDVENGVFKISENLLKSQPEIASVNEFSFKEKNTLLLATSKGLKELSFGTDSLGNFSSVKAAHHFNFLKDQKITSILNQKNIFWVGTFEGMHKITIDRTRAHVIQSFGDSTAKESANSPLMVNTIFEDDSGSIWVGTIDKGLFIYNQEEDIFEHLDFDPKNELGLSSPFINAIFQDNFNVLWIGTAQGGINKLDITQKRFFTYTNNPYDKSSIADNLTTSIIEDRKGRLWISGYNKPLYRSTNLVNENTVQNLKFENLESRFPLVNGDIVRRIYEDDRGYLWFGTDSTVVVYNPKKDVFKELQINENEVPAADQYTGDIYQIDKKNILLAGNKIRILENPWSQIEAHNYPSISTNSVVDLGLVRTRTILSDQNNSFWFGTSEGLFHGKFDGQKFDFDTIITDKQEGEIKLSYNDIFSIHKSDDQNIWIGTFGGGLNRLSLDNAGNPVKVEYFRKNNLLPDDAIYGILQEGDKKLWISTDMGLVRFHLDNNKVDVFDVHDGLPQNNFRQSSYFKGKSGYFYFGGLNGLTIFKPEEIKLNDQPPEILITDLLINNKKVEIGAKLNDRFVLKKSISETENIVISQNQQIMAFNVAVKHTSAPSKNRLAYKLDGFNDSWIEENTGKTTVTYTNLSAGSYVLRIKAANGDGVWSTETKVLNIEILPPWYRTWWSYLIFSLLAIAICAGIIIYFVQHERLKQRLKYEKLDKERIHTINQGKFRYFTNLSHEFRTPLTLIAGPLEKVMNHNTDENNYKYLAIIQKNTKRLLSLADQLITFRKAEQGHINLNLSKNTLGGFMYPTTEAFEDYAIEKNINFFYKINSPNEEIVIDVEKSERIIFNLLSNAFKNTPPGGNISIESGITNVSGQKMIKIDVIDTGKGIPESDLENIFERFYQLGNKNGNISGGGIGLAFCKSLIDLLGGDISVKSNPNIETRFSITIPSRLAKEQNEDVITISEKSFIKDWVPLSSEVTQKEPVVSKNGILKEHTVLVVENEVDVQTFLMGTLSETYNVTLANNGVEGLQKIKQQQPDLIISDIMMPEMDGFEFCEKIKSDTTTCHIPVLLLTALGENQDIIKGLEFGADEYISKPFSIKHLELRIEKLIQNNVQLKEYFSKNSTLPKKDIGISKRDKEFLSNVIDIIENNISNSNFGIEELASKIGLSTSHFYRRLKQLTGQIPNVYLRNYRLQRAAELLKNNEGLNVAEVMYQIGIESNSYFSTSFKKLHGVSPSEYLKKA
ncbi:hybrid sensor histidine kinase/response regulator transcription factor [Flagellimonas eckloniae]|uniref:histidine kinase n=1 Tax=Flagellimonas eckloniae TaxID=346185 RepID=A0A0Q1BGQ5_9FLAO|nr:two-component regulator propeller domain-containing protein [Allomuricauda eckloniae]KQC29572.1 hypothetical protein AAY42_06505 [Allomuricauda eckloniae]